MQQVFKFVSERRVNVASFQINVGAERQYDKEYDQKQQLDAQTAKSSLQITSERKSKFQIVTFKSDQF